MSSEPKPDTPERFRQVIAGDIARWRKVVDEAGLERI